MEVKPVLEVLIGKTMEQSLLEVAEEEELQELRKQQQIQMEILNADLAEVERLVERNRRYRCVILRCHPGLLQASNDNPLIPKFLYRRYFIFLLLC